jgi:hypothetical protein
VSLFIELFNFIKISFSQFSRAIAENITVFTTPRTGPECECVVKAAYMKKLKKMAS